MASSTSNSDITAHERFVGIEKAEELLKGIIIPPRPAVLVGVLEEQARPDPDLTKIGDLIASDVALAASTLKVVNSPFFGLRRKVGSVHHAVSLLGVSNIVHIVTGLMLHTAFRDEKNPFMNEYWTKTNRIALVSALVARTYTDVAPEEAYTTGLFLDCGIPLLLRRFKNYPDVYRDATSQTERPMIVVEDEVLGTDHTLAGLLVARSWALPDAICQCVLRHHDTVDLFSRPNQNHSSWLSLLAISLVSQQLAAEVEGQTESFEWRELGSAIRSYMGLNDEALEDLRKQVLQSAATATSRIMG